MQSKDEHFSIGFLDGFYEEEKDDYYLFRWMGKNGKIGIKSEKNFKYLQFNCFSNFRDLTQELKISRKGKTIFEGKLLPQWHLLTFELNDADIELEFETNKVFPKFYYPEDTRTLSIRIANFKLHNDEKKFKNIKDAYENGLKNIQEMSEGKTILSSFPQNLGIDLYEKCNIKPPCVYCMWDESKIMEGSFEDIKVNDETLLSYNNFYLKSRRMINCSIGEPFLNPSIEKILNLFEIDEKILEISTNGHCFSERILKIIEGKKLIIYISLDAASEKIYSRLRNDQFPKVYENLKKLKYIRKNGWPKIYLVFMPMKANYEDLENFFILGKEIEADNIILRPLNYTKEKKKPIKRGDYIFNYNREILNYKENLEVWDKALNLSERYQISVINQLFFGTEEKKDGSVEIPEDADLCRIPYPICREPWENYYILRRGIIPCCYGFKPIAKMDSFQESWNSKEIIEIRKYLREGKFSPYCIKSETCPIVMRSREKKKNIIKIFLNSFKK